MPENSLSLVIDEIVLSASTPEELLPLTRSSRLPLRKFAIKLVEEGRSHLIDYDDACEFLSELSLYLEASGFFLTSRRAAYLLKEALLTLDSAWSYQGIQKYFKVPPSGANTGHYFQAAEAIKILGSTLRMRPELSNVDPRVGLARSMCQIYSGHWLIGLLLDHQGGAVFFDRSDFEMLIVVDEPFSSSSICGLGLDNPS